MCEPASTSASETLKISPYALAVDDGPPTSVFLFLLMILQSSTANLLRGNICGLGPIQAFQAGFSVGPVLISCFLFIQAFFIYWSCLIPFPLCLLFCHQQPLLLLLPLAVAVCLAVVDRNILRKGDVTESNVLAVSRRLRRPLINANPLRF